MHMLITSDLFYKCSCLINAFIKNQGYNALLVSGPHASVISHKLPEQRTIICWLIKRNLVANHLSRASILRKNRWQSFWIEHLVSSILEKWVWKSIGLTWKIRTWFVMTLTLSIQLMTRDLFKWLDALPSSPLKRWDTALRIKEKTQVLFFVFSSMFVSNAHLTVNWFMETIIERQSDVYISQR